MYTWSGRVEKARNSGRWWPVFSDFAYKNNPRSEPSWIPRPDHTYIQTRLWPRQEPRWMLTPDCNVYGALRILSVHSSLQTRPKFYMVYNTVVKHANQTYHEDVECQPGPSCSIFQARGGGSGGRSPPEAWLSNNSTIRRMSCFCLLLLQDAVYSLPCCHLCQF